jgi:FRG domain-containing protein
VREIRVESWLELQECLFADSWHEELRRFRSDFAFRGESSATNDLTTSLSRLGGDYATLEQHLLRSFRKYAPRREVPVDSLWNWLALAKHHNLPTRLLDWSYSPYVALHFVTAHRERFDCDGAVWVVDFVRAREQLPQGLRALLEREGGNAFSAEMLEEVAPTLREFDGLGDDFVAFFEPPSLDDRIVNQYALFSLMPSAATQLDTWIARHPELAQRIIVPAELKWEVRDKLDQANVTERVLFPGLDGLTAWLKRYYSPREKSPPWS